MRGPKQALNFGLTPDEQDWVQGMSVQQLLGALQAVGTGEERVPWCLVCLGAIWVILVGHR
jgi:hypothetical protein